MNKYTFLCYALFMIIIFFCNCDNTRFGKAVIMDAEAMIYIEGGTKLLSGRNVTVSDFKIGACEVTFNKWSAVISWALSNGYKFKKNGVCGSGTDSDLHPVTTISWKDAIVWCNAYSAMSGLTPCYYKKGYPLIIQNICKDASLDADLSNDCVLWSANGYRLPTDAEWEYAAKGAKLSKNYIYAGGNSIEEVAWYGLNSDGSTHSVGCKYANEIGLYDMSGNVFEFCWDWWKSNLGTIPETDPRGPDAGVYKSIRGGGWKYSEDLSWFETGYHGSGSKPDLYGDYIGFRLAKSK